MRTLKTVALAAALAIAASGLAGALAPGAHPGAAMAQEQRQVTIQPDIVYGHKDGMALVYDVFRPANATGAAVLYMVSGGWVSRWAPPQTRVDRFGDLMREGITVVAVHHGSSPRFKVPDAVADVRRAVRHVRLNSERFGIDPDRLGVVGGSAGGHLSLVLGLAPDDGDPNATDPVERVSNRVKTVVAYYPPVDLRRMTGPSDRFPALDFENALAADISPLLFVDAADPPVLVIHGDADTLVPISSGRSIHEALDAAGVDNEFIVIEGGEHGFPDPDHQAEAEAAMVAWFAERL
jgi:acetyl esterase/lipase